MRAGLLRYVLRVEQKTLVQGEYGGHAETWADLGFVRGGVEALATSERNVADHAETVATHRVITRRRALPARDHLRFTWRGRHLAQVGQAKDAGERLDDLEFDCRDVGPVPPIEEAQ